jgi:hypothetical protein
MRLIHLDITQPLTGRRPEENSVEAYLSFLPELQGRVIQYADAAMSSDIIDGQYHTLIRITGLTVELPFDYYHFQFNYKCASEEGRYELRQRAGYHAGTLGGYVIKTYEYDQVLIAAVVGVKPGLIDRYFKAT